MTTDPYDHPPPGMSEQYASAIGTSNLRVQQERRTPADMVIAAGMNPHRLGMALRRLATEWDAAGKPPRINPENLEAMAAKYPRFEDTGLVLWTTVDRDGARTVEKLIPLVAAKREADAWYAHELGLLFQRLKTLPEVRAALVHWAGQNGIENPVHVVAAVLQWWLNQVCPFCNGVKQKVVLGTGRTSSKNCGECKGTGEVKVPHGSRGRRMLGHMNHCMREAAAGLKGKFSHHTKKE